MKIAIKRILIVLLVLALLVGTAWYLLVYDTETVREFLSAQARNCAENGHFDAAVWFHDLSYQFSDKDQNLSIDLAEIYKDAGNYTKAEATLANAIADGGTAELYAALCRTYVEQDKLLDAVNMLDNIADPAIKAELDAQRPAAPTPDLTPGFYSQYISVTFSHQEGTLYVSTNGEYPSTATDECATAVDLPGGETKIYALTVGINGLVSPLTLVSYTVGGIIEEVTLQDPAINRAVRRILMVDSDKPLYTDDLWAVSEFTVPAEAQSLDDLAQLTYLQKLTITDRRIDDLNFLTGMFQLQELTVTGCRVNGSLAPLAQLASLTDLVLSRCSISSIIGMENLPTLKHLDLSGNAIGNIFPLGTIPTLETVDLSDNAVYDLTPLANLTQLTRLDLSDNVISSLAPLAACTGLTELDVSHNRIYSIAPLAGLGRLNTLQASYNQISDCGPLAKLTDLVLLDLSHNKLTDLTALSRLSALTDLDFSYNDVSVPPSFSTSSALVVIRGDYNQLKSLAFLDKLDALNYIYMDYNPKIAKIAFLADNPNLVQVSVFGTAVTTEQAGKLLDRSIIVHYDPT